MPGIGRNSKVIACNVPVEVWEHFDKQSYLQKRTKSALAAEVLVNFVAHQKGDPLPAAVEEPATPYGTAKTPPLILSQTQLRVIAAMIKDMDTAEAPPPAKVKKKKPKPAPVELKPPPTRPNPSRRTRSA